MYGMCTDNRFFQVPLCNGDETKAAWKPLLNMPTCMGSAEHIAQRYGKI